MQKSCMSHFEHIETVDSSNFCLILSRIKTHGVAMGLNLIF